MTSVSERLRKIQRDNGLSLVQSSVDKLNDNLDIVAETPAEKIQLGADPIIGTEKNHRSSSAADEPTKGLQVDVPISIWQRMTVLKARTGMKMKDIQVNAFIMYLESLNA